MIFYQDDAVTLYQGDNRLILPKVEPDTINIVITDPPYSERTHNNARTNKQHTGKETTTETALTFAHIEDKELTKTLETLAAYTDGWIVSFMDYKHAFFYDVTPPQGLTMKRIGIWQKTNPMPQISADRPGTGWEAIAYLHRTDHKSSWNGGGKHGNYCHPTRQRAGHPTAKPLEIVEDMIRKFTQPGDTILDPYAGIGTTLEAAKNTGRKAIGIELDPDYCQIAAARLAQEVLPL